MTAGLDEDHEAAETLAFADEPVTRATAKTRWSENALARAKPEARSAQRDLAEHPADGDEAQAIQLAEGLNRATRK